MVIYIMRHGQSNYNELGLCNDDPGHHVYLTKTEIEQARHAAIELADAKFDRIYVSELPRTQQTARIINQYHNAL